MHTPHFYQKLRNPLLSLAIGGTGGLLVSLFLHSLEQVTHLRELYPPLLWGLPLVGLLIPALYIRYGFGAERGLRLVLEEVHRPQQLAPWTMAPLIYITTLLTHLVGGSAGREGTALQMSASCADRLGAFFKVPHHQRRWVLMAGLSAGFSAALGAPWAGMLFGLEVITQRRISREQWLECLIASVSAWFVAVALKAPHFSGINLDIPSLSFESLEHLLFLALGIGLLARLHVGAVYQLEHLVRGIKPRWRTATGGILLLTLYFSFPLNAYQGLGLQSIQQAFTIAPSWETPWLKLLLTAITLAFGFKGGEFIPLVFIGSTFGSILANECQEPLAMFTALGFVSLFAAAAKTPFTGALLAMEYFGWRIGPTALLVTLFSTFIAGPRGIYPGQQIKP